MIVLVSRGNHFSCAEEGRTAGETSLAHWRRQLEAAPRDENLKACVAIATFRELGPKHGMPLLKVSTRGAMSRGDHVTLEYMGAAYGAMARKLALVRGVEAEEQRQAALTQSADWFERAVRARSVRERMDRAASNWRVRKRAELPGDSPFAYPQRDLAQPRPLLLRGWGDALAWAGRAAQSREVFSMGVDEGIWRSPWCRSTPELPVASPVDKFFVDYTELLEHVAKPFEAVADALKLEWRREQGSGATEGWTPEEAGLHEGRLWAVLPLRVNGAEVSASACAVGGRFETACKTAASIPAVARLAEGQVKISRMDAGTHVLPHAGPTNGRLRMHCALQAPGRKSGEPGNAAHLRVGQERRPWKAGSCFVFDESCEHEVFVERDIADVRAVLIVDFANPLLLNESDFVAMLAPEAVPGENAGALEFYRSLAPLRDRLAQPVAGAGRAPGGRNDVDGVGARKSQVSHLGESETASRGTDRTEL